MNFRIFIDTTKEEEITAIVHKRTPLIDEIEKLILQHNGTDKIPAYNEDEMKMLPFSEIECITVLEGKTYAIDVTGTHFRLHGRLYEIEALLPSNFIRINKSSLANENRLVRFRTAFNGTVDAVFKCGYVDYVSRRCFAQIKRRFDFK